MSIKTDLQSITIEKAYTKADILSYLGNATELPRKKVEEVLTRYYELGAAHLKQGIPFSSLGLVKFYVIEKPETKAGERMNPFTKEMTMFPAKPAHKSVRIKALKKMKEMVN